MDRPGSLYDYDFLVGITVVFRAAAFCQNRPATCRRCARCLDDGNAVFPDRADRRLSLCAYLNQIPDCVGTSGCASDILGSGPFVLSNLKQLHGDAIQIQRDSTHPEDGRGNEIFTVFVITFWLLCHYS